MIIGGTLLHLVTIIPLIYCLVEVTKTDTAISEAGIFDSNITDMTEQVDYLQYDVEFIVNETGKVVGLLTFMFYLHQHPR